MIGIYKIINPMNKIYIGQSINIDSRFHIYKKLYKESIGIKLYNSLKKYGWENHIFKIIEECSVEQLNKREIYWIKFYNSIYEGLNIELGGKGGPRNIETKEKIKISSMGKNAKPILQYDVQGNFLKKWPSIICAENQYGKGIKEVLAKKIKTAHQYVWRYENDPLPSDFILNKYQNNKKKVFQCDLNSNLIKIWDSTRDIEKELNYPNSNISACCLKKQKTAYGYKWNYE